MYTTYITKGNLIVIKNLVFQILVGNFVPRSSLRSYLSILFSLLNWYNVREVRNYH